jgi:putative flippase GtrA
MITKYYEQLRRHLQIHRPRLYKFSDRYKAIIKFIFAGIISGGTDLIFLYIAYGLVHTTLTLATSLAFILSFFISFSLQKLWTFRNTDSHRTKHQFFLYMATAFISLNLNGLLMHWLVFHFRQHYILSQIAVNLTLGLINFLVLKFFIFRHHETLY